MVPKQEEPLYLHSHYFITPKRTIFAASNFDTTSKLTLQIVDGVQQNLYAMKQTTSNSMNTLDRKASQKQDVKSKKAEAKARSRVNRNWEKVQNSQRYRSASAKVVCDTVTKKIEVEVLDGILLKLNIKSQLKPTSVQNRILRRIVEKRQAQANHQKHGRTEDLASIHVSITSTSRCMETIRKKRFAA